jgi:hypothetical protein
MKCGPWRAKIDLVTGMSARIDRVTKRAFGRCLSDFRLESQNTLHGLLPAEERLLVKAAKGERLLSADTLPSDPNDENRVRGGFVRFLCLGGDEEAPVHERGIMLSGAFIEADIDLMGVSTPHSIRLHKCNIAGEFHGNDAHFGRLSLHGCRIKAITCIRTNINGSVALDRHFVAEGQVSFQGARIGGELNCTGGTFLNKGRTALRCNGAKIGDDVILEGIFVAGGEVNFLGANIGGQLRCSNGKFHNRGKTALLFDGSRIGGDVFLDEGFTSDGAVRFLGSQINGKLKCSAGKFYNKGHVSILFDEAKISGDALLDEDGFISEGEVSFNGAEIGGALKCSKGKFFNKNNVALSGGGAKFNRGIYINDGFLADGAVRFPAAEVGRQLNCSDGTFACKEGYALHCDRAIVNGAVYLRQFAADGTIRFSGTTIRGGLFLYPKNIDNAGYNIDLRYANSNVIADDPQQLPQGIRVCLNGFVYEQLGNNSPTDAQSRKNWLLREPGPRFYPQPYEQLAKVLREMGHEEDAREIARFKQERVWKLRVETAPWYYRPWVELTRESWGLFCGYGYKPHRLLAALAFLWGACALVYYWGAVHGAFVPADANIWLDRGLAEQCRPNKWVACEDKVPEMTAFSPLVYSADVLQPVVNLGQRSTWSPTSWIQYLVWLESALGTLGVLVFGAIVSGLIKRD